MINEHDRRLPTGSFDVPVVLPDGQTWYLPRPRIRFRPVAGVGKTETVQVHSFGPAYLELLEDYYRSGEDESQGSGDRFVSALMALSVALLRHNYELTNDELADLLYFDFSDPPDQANAAMRGVLVQTALGLPQKKISSDGSGPT